jgi:hypothetical protein
MYPCEYTSLAVTIKFDPFVVFCVLLLQHYISMSALSSCRRRLNIQAVLELKCRLEVAVGTRNEAFTELRDTVNGRVASLPTDGSSRYAAGAFILEAAVASLKRSKHPV